MKKLFLLLFGFIITGSINAQTRAEIFAKENTEKLSNKPALKFCQFALTYLSLRISKKERTCLISTLKEAQKIR